MPFIDANEKHYFKRIMLFGLSGSGKTLSALYMARGLAGPDGKVGIIDTEGGRAHAYARKIPGGYGVSELPPPFAPQRYIEKLQEAVSAGLSALVIDSMSHAWQGSGGILDQADKIDARGPKWAVKIQNTRLVDQIKSLKMHVIMCCQGKINHYHSGKFTKDGPMIAAQDSLLRFDLSTVLPMLGQGNYDNRLMDQFGFQQFKTDDAFAGVLDGTPISLELGERMRRCMVEYESVDPEYEAIKISARIAAAQGVEAYDKWRAEFKAKAKDKPEILERFGSNDHREMASQARAASEQIAVQKRMAADQDAQEPEPREWASEVMNFCADAAQAVHTPGGIEAYRDDIHCRDFLRDLRAAVASDESLAPLLAQAEGAVE
jgi:hypothetical protein